MKRDRARRPAPGRTRGAGDRPRHAPGTPRGPRAARPSGPGPAARAADPAPWLARACTLAPFAAALALAWSLRGAPLGSPVADDFEFLARLRLGHGLDPFDSMGAAFYWRPLSRQLWFSLVGPLTLEAPALVGALHALLLATLAWVLFRIARRFAGVPVAALLAAVPLLSEPARALIDWPSGAQHLLAALGAAVALHEALAGRRWSAGLAALAAALAHEYGALAFPLMVAGAGSRRGWRAARTDALLALGLALLWLAGYRVALAHGVRLPAGGASAGGGWLAAATLTFAAMLGSETLPPAWAAPVQFVAIVLVVASALALLLPSRRRRWPVVAAACGVALGLWAVSLLPLARLLPDWNGWRAFLPVVSLGFALTALAAEAHAALGLGLAALRLAALLGAAVPGPVAGHPPAAASDLSYTRIVRLQRIVGETGRTVRAARLRRGARVDVMGLPQLSLNGFRDTLALRVWLGDPSASFQLAEGESALARLPDLLLTYDLRPGRSMVVPVERQALVELREGLLAVRQHREADAIAPFQRALAAQRVESPSLSSQILHQLAVWALNHDRVNEAESLNVRAKRLRGPTPDTYGIEAVIALRRGDTAGAETAIATCLDKDPNNSVGLQALAALRRIQAASPGPTATGR